MLSPPRQPISSNRSGIGPLQSDVSMPALSRAGLRATAEVLSGLGVTARTVIFGHTHRAGPFRGDDPGEWATVAGGPAGRVVVAPVAAAPALPGQVRSGVSAAAAGHAPTSGAIIAAAAARVARRDMAAPDRSDPS